MAVEIINEPLMIYTCDLCQTQVKDRWLPPNWEGISLALYGGGMGQLHICDECQHKPILMLLNKVKVETLVHETIDSGD